MTQEGTHITEISEEELVLADEAANEKAFERFPSEGDGDKRLTYIQVFKEQFQKERAIYGDIDPISEAITHAEDVANAKSFTTTTAFMETRTVGMYVTDVRELGDFGDEAYRRSQVDRKIAGDYEGEDDLPAREITNVASFGPEELTQFLSIGIQVADSIFLPIDRRSKVGRIDNASNKGHEMKPRIRKYHALGWAIIGNSPIEVMLPARLSLEVQWNNKFHPDEILGHSIIYTGRVYRADIYHSIYAVVKNEFKWKIWMVDGEENLPSYKYLISCAKYSQRYMNTMEVWAHDYKEEHIVRDTFQRVRDLDDFEKMPEATYPTCFAVLQGMVMDYSVRERMKSGDAFRILVINPKIPTWPKSIRFADFSDYVEVEYGVGTQVLCLIKIFVYTTGDKAGKKGMGLLSTVANPDRYFPPPEELPPEDEPDLVEFFGGQDLTSGFDVADEEGEDNEEEE